jgi:hypothetical protein
VLYTFLAAVLQLVSLVLVKFSSTLGSEYRTRALRWTEYGSGLAILFPTNAVEELEVDRKFLGSE